MLLAQFSIAAAGYSANENGDLMSGTPESYRIYTIYAVDNRVFDVQNALSADNSIVWTYPYNGDECQEWRFIRSGYDYVIQDSHSGKYLTVKGDSSSANAEVVISSRPSAGYSSGQLFRVEQIGTSMRYRILSKCSNYTLAIGYNSSNRHLCQLAKTSDTAQVYLTESGPYHGLQEGYVHIQQYNTVYSADDRMLGINLSAGELLNSKFSNTAIYEWRVRYQGNGYFSISRGNNYLYCTGSTSGTRVLLSSNVSQNGCLWKITKSGNYYQLAPKSAVSGDTASAVLGLNSAVPTLVSSSSQYGRLRIIRSHYYYNYDMTIYAAEDHYHSNNYSSHTDIFNYACSSLYLKNRDNQCLIFTNNDEPYYDTSEITDLMKTSNMFVLRAHGSPTSFVLNAKDGNGSFIGSTTTYNISLINNMNSSALNNLKCALFLSCSSAEDSYSDGSSASNFVTAVVDRGARSAIGFDGSVDCRRASMFSSYFFEYFANNQGVDQVVASDAFDYTLRATRQHYNEDTYQPYFYNGYV